MSGHERSNLRRVADLTRELEYPDNTRPRVNDSVSLVCYLQHGEYDAISIDRVASTVM